MKNKNEILEYLSLKLKAFILNFPETKTLATVDDSNVAFIQIRPNSIYFHDENYVNWEDELMDDFLEKFPDYNISFLTDVNTFYNIKNWDLIFIGSNFDNKPLGHMSSNVSMYEISSFNIIDFSTNTNIKSIGKFDFFSTNYGKQEYINFDFHNNKYDMFEDIGITTVNTIIENDTNLTVNFQTTSEISNSEEVILAA